METVGFKKNSGAAQNDFDAVIVRETPHLTESIFTDINKVHRKVIGAEYKEFSIRFGFLDESEITYLDELLKEAAPQFIYSATTYDIVITEHNVRSQGGSMKVRKTAAE